MSSHRTVLVIVDFDQSNHDYEYQLQQEGRFAYRVLVERYNPESLDLPQLQQIDGILLELSSPRSGSLDVLKQLKERLEEQCPPIVVVGGGDAEMAVRAFKSGATDYLVNDRMTADDLRSAMRNAIETAELRRKLQGSQEQFHTSVENMLDCFGIFSSLRDDSGQIVDFRIDYLNAAACENNRMPKEAQLGRGLCEVLPAHRTSGLFAEYCQLVETGEPLLKDSLIYDDIYGDQRLVRAFEIRATKLNDGFVAAWRDVTDRRRLELELSQTVTDLRQQQQRLQRLIDTAPIGIAIVALEGDMTVMNDTMLHLHGYTREAFEQQGLNWRNFIPPELAERAEQNVEQLRQQGVITPQEMELLHPDGTRVPILFSATQWMNRSDEHVVFAVDLSPQKQAEAAIQQLNRDLMNRVAELQTLFDIIPLGIAIATDPTCTQMQHNAYLRQLLGVDPGSNISKSAPVDQQPPYRVFQDGQEIPSENLPMQVAARLGIEVRDTEFAILLPDGTVRQVLSYATPLRGDQNQIRGVIGAFLDITERNRDAVALKANQQRYRELAEAMPQMVWTADATGAVDYWNQRWYEYTGLNEAESMGLAGVSTVHPDDRDRTLSQWGQSIAHEVPFEVEYRIRHRDGEYRWFICRAIPTRDERSQITGWIGTITNIDDLKRSESLVQQSEQQLQRQLAEIEAIYQSAPIGLNVLDTDLRFVRINQRLADINGLPVEAHIGRSIRELFPDLAATIEQLLRPILETGEPLLNVEIHGETPAQPGVKRTWLEHFLPLKQGDQVIGISTVCEEITERMQVETALRQSEERFRTMADNAPMMIWVTDATGYCTYLSERWYEFTGQTEATGLGFGWLEAVHPDDRDYSRTIFLNAIKHHETFQLEYRLRRQDGEYRWAIDAASPWLEPNGEFKGYIGSVIDISDRKQTEEALRQSEERYRYLAEAIPQLVWTCDATGLCDYVNQRLCDYTGLTVEQAMGQGWLSSVHPEDRPLSQAAWMEAARHGSYYRHEYRFRRASDGSYRWHLVLGLPVKDQWGRVVKWFGTCTDIHDQKELELERDRLFKQEQAAREAAERANRVKDEFLAVLSHELRSPLNPILGWTKLLQMRKLNETKTAEALATIERNAKLQTQLIDDLLDIAKILRGKLNLNTTSVNLVFVIEAAIETVKTAAVAKSISLRSVLPNIGQVVGDAARLQQVVWNLLSNAIKFTPSGGRVEVWLESVGNQAQITVKDTGRGISPGFLPHLFESFRQEDASITRKYGGLGLGLAIVRQLVEMHGGTITADSPGEGLGAAFTVRLPLLKVAPEAKQTDQLPQQDLDLTGVRVLAVDDDADARELLTVLLVQYGAEVLSVTSAAEALANLDSFQPHVLVSDIGMPEIDGYTLIQQIRTLSPQAGGRTPAIALTAYARDVDYQKALISGYQRHVTKPLDPEQLVQAVADLVHRSDAG